jgi:hypothetical protein
VRLPRRLCASPRCRPYVRAVLPRQYCAHRQPLARAFDGSDAHSDECY